MKLNMMGIDIATDRQKIYWSEKSIFFTHLINLVKIKNDIRRFSLSHDEINKIKENIVAKVNLLLVDYINSDKKYGRIFKFTFYGQDVIIDVDTSLGEVLYNYFKLHDLLIDALSRSKNIEIKIEAEL